jgi:hypothetical protein
MEEILVCLAHPAAAQGFMKSHFFLRKVYPDPVIAPPLVSGFGNIDIPIFHVQFLWASIAITTC